MSQKYNFKGIKKVGAASIIAVLHSILQPSGFGWLISNSFSKMLLNAYLQPLMNAFANKGLLFINVGLINFSTEKDQVAYVEAMKEALKMVENSPKLTPQKIKEIDDAVIDKYDKFAVFGKLRKP